MSTIFTFLQDTFLESFFGPGMALHVREFGANATELVDDFRINLHRCFGDLGIGWAERLGPERW